MRMSLWGWLLLAVMGLSMFTASAARAEDWRKQFSEINIGVITEENQSDMLNRWQPVADYLGKTLGVKVTIRPATSYAGVIEAMKAKKIQMAWFGPASYAEAWIVTGGKLDPLVTATDNEGNVGYHSVLVVLKDSPYKSIEDLKGKKLALADPNSTSGCQAPTYFLREKGIDINKFFASATFSGSHENSVIGLINGTYDAAVTWWNSETYSNFARMASKGMIPKDAVRIIWKSPLLPNEPWTMPTWLPEQMRGDMKQALLAMPDKAHEVFDKLFTGSALKLVPVTTKDYEPIVKMVQDNQKHRKES